MGKPIFISIMILMLLVLSSCMPESRIPPDGIWHSEEPNVTLYLKPEYKIIPNGAYNPGHFVVNDDVLNIAVRFGPANRVTMDYNLVICERGLRSTVLLVGNWRMRGEQIHLILLSGSQERLGYSVIVFSKIETYDPIDPADWIIDEREELEEHGD